MMPAPNGLSSNQRFVERYSVCIDKGMGAIYHRNVRYRTRTCYRDYPDFNALSLCVI